MPWTTLVLAFLAAGLVAAAYFMRRAARSRHVLGNEADRAMHNALHLMSAATPLLRGDLTQSGDKAAGYLRLILGVPTAAIATETGVLGWDGPGRADLAETASALVAEIGSISPNERTVQVWTNRQLRQRGVTDERLCAMAFCLDNASGHLPGRALVVFIPGQPSTRHVRAMKETGRFVASQFELAALDAAQAALAKAEVTALRAQISPHFIYNSLHAIANYTRSDPEHARELLLDFAEFTRYSFRKREPTTTLAEELAAIEKYLALEQARFGDRLRVSLDIAPEALSVRLPYLCLQPLVENAVKHGIERRAGQGHIAIVARSVGHDVLLSIDDDGAGMDPDYAAQALAGEIGDSLGIANVDQRLVAAYGHGLDLDTGPGAGTKVSIRIPKFAVVDQ